MLAATAIPALVVGYLLGSIPFGLLLSRASGLGDIRAIGSGNIGATNVLRTGRKDIAAATLLLDAAKGAVAVLAAHRWGGYPALVAAVAAVAGHCTSPWVGFRGGKGVATGLGAVAALSPLAGAGACLAWLLAALGTRRSSAGALLAFLAAPLLMLELRPPAYALATLLVTLLILARHQTNIRRLLAGTEPRIGAAKATSATQHPPSVSVAGLDPATDAAASQPASAPTVTSADTTIPPSPDLPHVSTGPSKPASNA